MIRETKRVFLTLAVTLIAALFAKAEIVVAADGTGDVRTVREAVDKICHDNRSRVVIRIRPGTYFVQVRVPADKPYISFIGESAEKTKITFNLSNRSTG